MRFKLFLSVIAFLTLLSITGCSGEGAIPKPPRLTVEAGEETAKLVLGSYNWDTVNEDGSGKGTDVESPVPPELIENTQPMQVTSDTGIELNFETQPNKYEVRIWEDSSVIDSSDKIILSVKGKVIYEVLAHWEQGRQVMHFPSM